MADPTPIAPQRRPEQGPPRTFRLRSMMLLIAVIAAGMALYRDDPVRGSLIALLLGSTAALLAWLMRLAERDKGQRPGPAGWAFLLCLALMSCILFLPALWLVLWLITDILGSILFSSHA